MGLNVLSLFGGISCGQIALNQLGIKIDNYFASEIDKYAIKVAQHNYPNTIQLGDITKINSSNLPNIDLLIGGSPCQGFSFAGKQLNFNDHRSKLFFQYVRILEECNPKYFLLENVKMKKEYQDIITNFIGIEPIKLNSNLFSKQNRSRLYWTNIPIKEIIPIKMDYNGWLYRLGHGYIKDEIKYFRKYPSLTAQSPGSKYRIINNIDDINGMNFDELRKNKTLTRIATPEECEEFQTIPIGYTSMLNKTQRYKCIGNGWTVNVIKHIFSGII